MIRVIKNFINIEGEWFTFAVSETIAVEVKIRPLIWEIGRAIEDRHKTVKSTKIHGSKIIKKTATNFEKFSHDLIDHVLEDFRGIGSDPDKPLEITTENKIKVLSIKGITDFIMEKAKALAVERVKEIISIDSPEYQQENV